MPESLSFGVAAMADAWGGKCVSKRLLPDDPVVLTPAATAALASADVVVVTGGASVGERDYAKAMFGVDLELIFSKVAIKPGKPVWLGRTAGKLVLGLPGNPTSAMVTARLFLAPLLLRLSGAATEEALEWRTAELMSSLEATGDREAFIRARWSGGRVEPLENQDSGAQHALALADLLIRRPRNSAAMEAGERVEIIDF
jgi:molybdopterin molybdotransferase